MFKIIDSTTGEQLAPPTTDYAKATSMLQYLDNAEIIDIAGPVYAAALGLTERYNDGTIALIAEWFGLNATQYLHFVYTIRKTHNWRKLDKETKLQAWANKVNLVAWEREASDASDAAKAEHSRIIATAKGAAEALIKHDSRKEKTRYDD